MKAVFLSFALALLAAAGTEATAIENGTQTSPQNPDLQPGDYVWQPQTSPTGPLVIVVDLSKQMLQVYRNGVLIGRSTVSSGTQDHPTPTGIFTILQKNVTHHSNVYHEASMPYMERLTWGGLAIHAGNDPGHPESHGCVHVPMAFAKKLYGITTKGTTVLVADGVGSAGPPAKPDLVFSSTKGPLPLPPPGTPAPYFSWKPERSPTGPVCIVFSSIDSRIYVYRSGVEIGRATVGETQPGFSVGDRVYSALTQTDAAGFHQWNLLGSLSASPAPNVGQVFQQLVIPPAFLTDLRQTVTPGTTLVITDQPVNKPHVNGTDILDTASE